MTYVSLPTLNRYAYGTNPLMDQLTYNYQQGTNRLTHVVDVPSHPKITSDIDDQPVGNYSYDASGNLVKDQQVDIDTILWNPQGKVEEIIKSTGDTIAYSYNEAGNRKKKP